MKSGVKLDPALANQALAKHFQQQNTLSGTHVEESVDDLIRKLENQGKKIKIIEDNEDEDDFR